MMRETFVDRWLARLPGVKTYEEQYAAEIEQKMHEAQKASNSIRNAQYTLHITLAHIEAMEDWRHGRNIRKEIPHG